MLLWQKFALSTSLVLFSFSALAVKVTDEVDVGGAVRINYGWKDYDDNAKLEFELFRADVNYQSKDGLFASAQYRWYQDMDAIHHAYMGYQFDETQSVQVGVTQVPFGFLPYAAHSFWFSAAYYLGFEDDYDAGVHYKNEQNGWRYDVAYFANDEYANGSRYDRYSFDVATTGDSPYEESGQVNARIEREFTTGEVTHKLGGSLQFSQLDFVADAANVNGEDSDSIAAAAHWQADWQKWQLQVQYMHYDYDVDSNRVAIGAFQYQSDIAAEADVAIVNIAKSFDVDWGPITQLNCYNDYSQVMVSGDGLADSIQNVTGCAITAGKFYSYVDWIAGKNMYFINGSGVGIDNGDTGWHSRLNINVGLYF
ncbi:hypothetical protein K8B83_17800 [Shewanella inventionis]|uniref:Outer membrane beta barrel protein n=1 Tax=Shewanella inventionis TaxID=1738770 RepID=A0ABQ1J758_9GAMM|nr:hypothetical protein [Shewanella inventionis]MCL1157942.1 hypothetical protein [Shewanella inventionis]UAL42661.1 hypothetical protein K8B83_17800 [Shewanella inventionis]GGB60339.1 outer membrane beta barrel protein [Shewanella inventionis]